MRNVKRLIGLVAVVAVTAIAAAAVMLSRETLPMAHTEFMMDTVCTVTLYDWDGSGDGIMDGVFDVCRECDAALSVSVSTSDVYHINHSDGRPVIVSERTVALLERAETYAAASGGSFDVTVYPVRRLWDFSGGHDSVPSEEALAAAVKLVDYTKLKTDGTSVTLPKGMGIDLGAVAKGYAADRMAQYLKEHQVRSAVIDLGGNILVVGNKPDGSNWRVGIQRPFGDGNIDVVEVRDRAVVTSGVYQRYFEKNGVLYHHILDPHSGKPCHTGLYSVTVIGENAEQCDALSTVCMLLGYDNAVKVLEHYPNVTAVFVTSEYEIRRCPSR